MKNVFYFGLEPLKSRYTYQLSEEWMPETFKKWKNLNFIPVKGEFDSSQQIKVGAVLDAIGRGKYSLTQCKNFLNMLYNDKVKDGDVLFFQDFWTPGVESIFYALDLYNIKVDVYSMLHAQSVDEYDFTYPMRKWMRYYELGLDRYSTGIFVGSSIHKEQLRSAGFESLIHVVSLPIHKKLTENKLSNWRKLEKKNVIVFSSRLDKEKNPYFMMNVASEFLKIHPELEWHITTSGKDIRSMLPGVVKDLRSLETQIKGFKILTDLTKEEYYTELATCKVQFNSSLQDYVSWTVLESTLFGADICFPNFRSFPEFIPLDRLYKPFDVGDAIRVLINAIGHPKTYNFSDISDIGRQMEGYIVSNRINFEINVWHELNYCKKLLGITK